MNIRYDNKQKDLPSDQLQKLFVAVGWADRESDDPGVLKYFSMPFVNSTLVVSAWDNARLIGAVRVLSDQMVRSAIYDLLVLPEYQNAGIGKELVKQCIARYPDSEWLVCTENHIAGYYEKLGFTRMNNSVFLHIPCKLFT